MAVLSWVSRGKCVSIISCLLITIVVEGLALPNTSSFLQNTNHRSREVRKNKSSQLFHSPIQGTENENTVPSSSTNNWLKGVVNKAKTHWTNHSSNKSQKDWKKVGMTLALFSTYFTVMGAKCALPSTLSMLKSDLTFLPHQSPQGSMARVLSMSTMAIAFGKILLGPIIDSVGGVLCLKVALAILSLNLATIAMTNQFSIFAKSYICLDFVFSSCWAACLHAIHQSFSPHQWASKIGTIATAARMGNAISFLTFASILSQWTNITEKYANIIPMMKPWRAVFLLAAVVQIIPFALLMKYGDKPKPQTYTTDMAKTNNDNKKEQSKITENDGPKRVWWKVLGMEMKKVEFWCHFVNRSVQMVIASFLLFVPSYMTNCFQMSPSSAASVGSIYAFGCFLSIFFGSKRYTQISPMKRIISTTIMTASLLGVCIGNLGHISGVYPFTPMMGSLMMFLWGISFAIPFYIPASMYALEQGGRESSATIADVFDVGGFISLALFNGYVAGIQQQVPSAWIQTFVLLSACSILSMISLALATLLENKQTQKQQ